MVLTFKGNSLSALVSGLLCVSMLIILLEWHAVHNIPKGAGSDRIPSRGDFASGAQAHLRGTAGVGEAADDVSTDYGDRHTGAAGPGASRRTMELSAKHQVPVFPTPPEVRARECVVREYKVSALPKVAVVIPYLNETWFHIEMTVASMLAHTPLEVVDEILFVDDGNSEEWQFHDKITGLHPKLSVHRNEERQGLVRSKVIGAALVKSPVIVFMEPHCIVGRQWLEPLLENLAQSTAHSLVVMPTLDIIPEEDFNQYRVANHHIGGFDWSLTFNWMTIIEQRNSSYRYPEPYATPALSGGIFGIWRDFWERMGTYDTNMTEWGGEHIEMSLRTWRCGGRIEVIPCSHIGHVFRALNPYVVHPMQVVRNTKRAALVWLDERLEDFYRETPMARHLDAGDVTERLLLKEKLNCQSMEWYIQNVYPELRTKQPRRR